LKDALIPKTKKLVLINVNGTKERLSDQVNQTSNKELISSELTSVTHQLLSTGTTNLDNASVSKTNKLAELMDKDNASGLLEKNFQKETSAVQLLFQITSKTS
jgi:predicted kinase